MSNELEAVAVPSSELSSEHITFTPFGVEFDYDHRPSIEEWHKAFLKVQSVHGMTQFYLGDLAVFAQSEVTGWGESKYDALVDATGYNKQTLAVFAHVARKFTPTFRKNIFIRMNEFNTVSFGHFQLVAPLMENNEEHAKYFLEMVRDGRWTVSKLREEIARYKNGGELPEPVEKREPTGAEISFNNHMKKFFKGWVPNLDDNDEYDEKSWLLEVRDVIDDKLHDLGIEV